MRKSLIAALTALTALAVAAVAIAQNPHRPPSLDGLHRPVEGRHEEEARKADSKLNARDQQRATAQTADKIEIWIAEELEAVAPRA